ncbi:MAG: hypothetical protein U0V70_17710 [Terriglobia bacterium]
MKSNPPALRSIGALPRASCEIEIAPPPSFGPIPPEAAAQAAEILGRDAGLREEWRHIARHLAPYPTHGNGEGQVVVDVEGAPPIEYNLPVPLFRFLPGEEVSDCSPRQTRDLFWRTLETFKKISVNGHVIVNAARVRAALPNAWELVRRDILDFIGPNGASDTYDLGTVVENLSITLPITELLLQSHEGLIRVFPGLPDSVDARFNSLRARGGFTVNSVGSGAKQDSSSFGTNKEVCASSKTRGGRKVPWWRPARGLPSESSPTSWDSSKSQCRQESGFTWNAVRNDESAG